MDRFRYYACIFIIGFVQEVSSQSVHLMQNSSNVWEEEAVILTCYFNVPENIESIFFQIPYGSVIGVPVFFNESVKDTSCTVIGNLDESFRFSCYSNGTFAVLWSKVQRKEQYDPMWGCGRGLLRRNKTLNINVPIKSVDMTYKGEPITPNTTIAIVKETNESLQCITTHGKPKPNITWFQRDSGDAVENDLLSMFSTSVSESNGLFSSSANLFFQPKISNDGDKIFCSATNRDSRHTESVKITLSILYPPYIKPLRNVSYIEGSSLNVLCPVVPGNPDVYYGKWTSENDREWNVKNNLTLRSISRNDTMYFTCVVQNTMRPTFAPSKNVSVQRAFLLDVLYPPDKPIISQLNGKNGRNTFSGQIHVIEGESLNLRCEANSNPVSNITWSGPDKSSTATLSFLSIGKEKNGTYTCYATNSMQPSNGGNQIGRNTADITINVLYPPVGPPFIFGLEHNSSFSVIENHFGSLSCRIIGGNPPPALSWNCFNGTESDEVFHGIVQKSIVWKAERGVNTCECHSNHSLSLHQSVSVEVNVLYPPSPPRFTVHSIVMDNIRILQNSTLIVICKSESNPESVYTWKSSKRLWLGQTLQFDLIRKSDNGTYACEAKNMMIGTDGTQETGQNTSYFTIHVLYPPEVFSMKNISILEGLPLNVTCPVKHGNPADSVVFWTGRNTQWNLTDLIIENVTRKHDAIYTCTVYNVMNTSNGNVTKSERSSEFHLNVLYEAKVTNFNINGHSSKTHIIANESEIISFNCTVEGNPIPNVQISLSDKVIQSSTEKYKLTLELTNTSCSDAGLYKCIANNNNTDGKTSKRDLALIVRCSPLPYYIKPNAGIAFASLEDSVILTFIARDYLEEHNKTTFTWYKDLAPINIIRDKVVISTNDLQTQLTINNVTHGDFGKYLLNVQNTIGEYSQTFELLVKESSTESFTESMNIDSKVTYIVVGSTLSVVIIVVIVVGICFYRKRRGTKPGTLIYQNVPFRAKPKKLRNEESKPVIRETEFGTLQELELDELDDVPNLYTESTEYCNTPEKIATIDIIKVTELFDYVSGKTNESFSVDFQKLPTALQKPCTVARRPENIALNRYNGIFPYDHSRVTINGRPDFFINACYIDGYKRCKAYIASLGPTAKTTDDFKTFWQMVWHEESSIIVMLTNLIEPSGMKCEQYWPIPENDEWYGDILISCQNVEEFAEYTIRSFNISKDEEVRSLSHLHYTAWPDKKVPEDVTSLLEFRQRIKATKASNGPVIVHCSAGIGRTGTLIALDRLIEEGQCEGSVNVYDCVSKMRQQRVKMVQTCEQYIYIYKALVNALAMDSDPIPIEVFTEYVDTTNNNTYSRQFQQLKQSVETESKEDSNTRSENEKLTSMNRHGADIPGDQNRVHLYLNRGSVVSDYINAVYINGFKKKDHFIMAQSPLPSTVLDFLCMIYQENCLCVVTMEDLKEPGTVVGMYLPTENHTLKIGDLTVSCSIHDAKSHYTVRKMKIKNDEKFSKGEKVVYHFQYNEWMTGNDIPANVEEFVEFVKEVEEYSGQLAEETSHVIVHCLKANQRSGLFCAVTTLLEKLKYERQVNVLNTLRHLRTRRRSAINSMEQLKFCYQATSAYIKM